jgi:hypothetical protein
VLAEDKEVACLRAALGAICRAQETQATIGKLLSESMTALKESTNNIQSTQLAIAELLTESAATLSESLNQLEELANLEKERLKGGSRT